MTRLNWSVPVNSLLNTLQKEGYKIYKAEDVIINENHSDLVARKKATEELVGVDGATLTVKKNNKMYGLFLVFGNDPEEIVADYTDNEELESVIDKYCKMWEGKKCPVIED